MWTLGRVDPRATTAGKSKESIPAYSLRRLRDSRDVFERAEKKRRVVSFRRGGRGAGCVSRVDTPPLVMTKPATAQFFHTTASLSRVASVNRSVVTRLLSQGLIEADGFIEPLAGAGAPTPIFLPHRAVDVVRLQRKDTFPAAK